MLGVVIYAIQQCQLDKHLTKYKNWISICSLFLISIPTNGENGLYTFMKYSPIPSGYLHMIGAAILIWTLISEAFPSSFFENKNIGKDEKYLIFNICDSLAGYFISWLRNIFI